MLKTERVLPTLTAPPPRHLCQLELNVDSSKVYRPGDTVKLNLQTGSRALVALGAVDTALYAVGGKSHKPLDMVKVGQVLSLIFPSLRGSSSSYPKPQPATRTHSAGLLPFLPRALAPVALFPLSVSLSYLSGPCPLTCS